MKKQTGILLAIIFFLLGIISGFMISPCKNGIYNTITTNHNKDRKIKS